MGADLTIPHDLSIPAFLDRRLHKSVPALMGHKHRFAVTCPTCNAELEIIFDLLINSPAVIVRHR